MAPNHALINKYIYQLILTFYTKIYYLLEK